MKYFITSDNPEAIINWSKRFRANHIDWELEQMRSVDDPKNFDIHAVFDKPANMSVSDICKMCNVKEAYLFFDTGEAWI